MYENKYSVGYEVLNSSRGYSLGSAGDIASNATHLITNDFPEYATMFYSPTQHEVISSIKYSKLELGYDAELREMQENINGMPLEFYIPKPMLANDGIGENEKPLVKEPMKISRTIIDEIEKAQKEIMGKEIVLREVEKIVLLMKTKKRELILRKAGKSI
jgi:hypothetical protein